MSLIGLKVNILSGVGKRAFCVLSGKYFDVFCYRFLSYATELAASNLD